MTTLGERQRDYWYLVSLTDSMLGKVIANIPFSELPQQQWLELVDVTILVKIIGPLEYLPTQLKLPVIQPGTSFQSFAPLTTSMAGSLRQTVQLKPPPCSSSMHMRVYILPLIQTTNFHSPFQLDLQLR